MASPLQEARVPQVTPAAPRNLTIIMEVTLVTRQLPHHPPLDLCCRYFQPHPNIPVYWGCNHREKYAPICEKYVQHLKKQQPDGERKYSLYTKEALQ